MDFVYVLGFFISLLSAQLIPTSYKQRSLILSHLKKEPGRTTDFAKTPPRLLV